MKLFNVFHNCCFTFFNEWAVIYKLPLHFTEFEIKMKLITQLFLFGLFFLIVSCGSTENKLIGIWKVDNVKTEFDENKTTPQMLQQVVEIQKQMHFKIQDDSLMIIITNNNTYEAVWSFDKSRQIINFHFKGDTAVHKLGDYIEPYIVSKSTTPLGVITTTYSKE
jgi:hypothetical protein